MGLERTPPLRYATPQLPPTPTAKTSSLTSAETPIPETPPKEGTQTTVTPQCPTTCLEHFEQALEIVNNWGDRKLKVSEKIEKLKTLLEDGAERARTEGGPGKREEKEVNTNEYESALEEIGSLMEENVNLRNENAHLRKQLQNHEPKNQTNPHEDNVRYQESANNALGIKELIQATISESLKEVKHELTEMKAAVAQLTSDKGNQNPTWAQVAAASPKQATRHKPKANTEEAAKEQTERQKRAIALTVNDAPETTKRYIKDTHPIEIIKLFQQGIEQQLKQTTEKIPKLLAVSKLSNGTFKFHCQMEEETKYARTINWAAILPGISEHKRKFGIVVHNIPVIDYDPYDDDVTKREECKAKLEEENTGLSEDSTEPRIHVAHVAPLRRRGKKPGGYNTSIIIYTNDAEEADACIEKGIFFCGQYYRPERYTPQLNLTQCYRCYGFGHKATQCRSKTGKCGHCADEGHRSETCDNKSNPKCPSCGGAHKAWDDECERKIKELERLEALRESTTAYFTK